MKRFVIALLFLPIFSPWAMAATEANDSPSQKTKEALKKAKDAAGIVEKIAQSLKGGEKAGMQPNAEKKTPPPGETASFHVQEKKPRAAAPGYSPDGRRDPFRPQTLRSQPVRRSPESLSPLERYELGQLKLVGIVWDIQEPRAMVEDSAGLGYSIKVGTPIGQNEGKVTAIKPTEVVVEEIYTDFYGARKNRSVRMRLSSQ